MSYLFAYMVVTGICLAVFLRHAPAHHPSGLVGEYSKTVQGFAGNLRWLWLGFVPIIVLVWSGHGDVLYPWADEPMQQTTSCQEGRLSECGILVPRHCFSLPGPAWPTSSSVVDQGS